MQLKLDVKTLVIGIALGAAITAAIGAGVGSADAARFGIAIEPEGAALIKTSDGSFYAINPQEGMAIRVLQASLRADLSDKRDHNNRPLNLGTPGREWKQSSRQLNR